MYILIAWMTAEFRVETWFDNHKANRFIFFSALIYFLSHKCIVKLLFTTYVDEGKVLYNHLNLLNYTEAQIIYNGNSLIAIVE